MILCAYFLSGVLVLLNFQGLRGKVPVARCSLLRTFKEGVHRRIIRITARTIRQTPHNRPQWSRDPFGSVAFDSPVSISSQTSTTDIYQLGDILSINSFKCLSSKMAAWQQQLVCPRELCLYLAAVSIRKNFFFCFSPGLHPTEVHRTRFASSARFER